jgi:hypothetical protein
MPCRFRSTRSMIVSDGLPLLAKSANQREYPDLRKGLGGSNDCLPAIKSTNVEIFYSKQN